MPVKLRHKTDKAKAALRAALMLEANILVSLAETDLPKYWLWN
jgi:hypothetical protein